MLKNICLATVSFVMTIIIASGLAEVGARIYKKHYALKEIKKWGDMQEYDPVFGYVGKKNVAVRDSYWRGDKLVCSGLAHMNEFGHRQCSVDDPERRSKFAMMFGCSIVYGLGLNDNQTIPSRFGELATDYVPYNMALPGWGPAQMLLSIQRLPLTEEVSQREGIAVYVFWPGHIRRLTGALLCVARWTSDFPYYDLGEDDALMYRGSYRQNHPTRTKIYSWIVNHSQLLGGGGFDWPLRVHPEDCKKTAVVILESKKEFLKRFPRGRFLVMPYFAAELPEKSGLAHIKEWLDKYQIEYVPPELVRSNLRTINRGRIFVDTAHPSEEACLAYAQALYTYLREKNEL